MPTFNPAFQPTPNWGYAPLLPDASVPFQYEVPQGPQLNTFTEHPSSGSGHESPEDQYTTPAYDPSSFIPIQYQYQLVQFCPPIEHPSPGSEHESSADEQSWLALSPSQSTMRERPQYRDHVLASGHPSSVYQHNALTFSPSQSATPMMFQYQDHHLQELADHASFNSGHDEIPAYEHDPPAFSPLQFDTPMESPHQDHELSTLTDHLPIDSGYETPTEQQDDGMSCALPRSVTPVLSQEQVDAQPNGPTPFILPSCPICRRKYNRLQERDRHLESYLSHSIYCPSQDCAWTGRRQSDLKAHWEKKHSETGRVLGKEKYIIYDPKDFVRSLINGSPLDEVASSAYEKAKKRVQELGKEDLGANVLGRKLEIPPPFIPPPPSLFDQCYV